MPFSGSGAGTIGDPFQITSLAEFRQINLAAIGVPQFSGAGLNDFSSNIIDYADGNFHTLVGSHTFTVTLTKSGAIATKSSYYDGSGYQTGDTFSIDGGTPGDLATGSIWSDGGNGTLYGFDITYAGSGYSTGAHTVTNIIGSGSGGHVNIVSLSPDQFKWKKDAGAETTGVSITGALQDLSNGIAVKFTATKGHTIGDVWVVPIEPVNYFKIMNNLDWAGQTAYNTAFGGGNFQGHIDGNSKEMLNMTVGVSYAGGLKLVNGCSIKDLIFRITASVNNNEYGKERTIFFKEMGALANVSITGIKVITSGTGQLAFLCDNDFADTCTLSDIVLEGDIQGVFTNRIRGVLQDCKVLRTTGFVPYVTSLPIVLYLDGEMKYCQHIILGMTINIAGYWSMMATYLQPGGKITESFAWGFVTITYPDPATVNTSHALVAVNASGGADATEVKDSYFKGTFSVNGGDDTNVASSNYGKSGFAVNASFKPLITRCIANCDIVSPLNDNRAVFCKDASTRITYSYYNKDTLVSITPVDVADRQVGLTNAQFVDEASFSTFDFDAVWIMGAAGPELRNNPLYAFETDIISVAIASKTRLSGTSFRVVLSVNFTSAYGIEIYNGALLVDTKTNSLSNDITVPGTDVVYTVKPFYMDGITKVYTTQENYSHYANDAAVAAAIAIAVDAVEPMGPVHIGSNLIHGSLLYNGYVYGGTRNSNSYSDAEQFQANRKNATLVRAALHDLANYEVIEIKATDKPDGEIAIGQFSEYIEQLVECGGYIYFIFTATFPFTGQYLCQYNPTLNEYKVFRIGTYIYGTAPLVTDGEFLYSFNYALRKAYKFAASQFVGAFPKYNVDDIFPVTIAAEYDDTSQGGAILGGYPSNLKGEVHTACCDATYLYAAFVTAQAAGDNGSGYFPSLGVNAYEVHKIRKSDMTAAGFVKIPKATDDMAQNNTHLFFGIEVQPGVDAATYGYGWGAFAVRKSDMHFTAIPRLHSREFPPVVQSYGSFLFGNYIVDIRTDKTIYVLDISDVDNWSPTELIAQRLVAQYSLSGLGAYSANVLNELLHADDTTLYGFLWNYPSEMVEFQITDVNLYSIPIVNTLAVVVGEANLLTFSGHLISNGDKPILSKGFKYGLAPGSLTSTLLSTDTAPGFHATLSGLAGGTYYYKAFAINSEGEASGVVLNFTIENLNSKIISSVGRGRGIRATGATL